MRRPHERRILDDPSEILIELLDDSLGRFGGCVEREPGLQRSIESVFATTRTSWSGPAANSLFDATILLPR